MSFDLVINNNLGNFSLLQHDIIFDVNGRLKTVSGSEKLIQDINKIINTTTNYFYNSYGAKIQQFIGTSSRPEVITQTLTSEVNNALNFLASLQQVQLKYQQLSATEKIQEIITVKTDYVFESTNNQNDLTKFQITIVVQNAAREVISASRTISLD